MFNEFRSYDNKGGWVEVICGPMFSGKTEELLRRLKRARLAQQPIAIFKPALDTRYSQSRIVSHDAHYFPSLPVKSSAEIYKHAVEAKVVAIDEAQFFDAELPEVVNQLALDGKRVILAGLDMDSKGQPFGVMPQLMAIADFVTKLNAICVQCGGPGTHSFRKVREEEQFLLGAMEAYEPRCRQCFVGGVIG